MTTVRAALTASLGRAIVMCHISHAYETGASLYFTVLTARRRRPTRSVSGSARRRRPREAIVGLGTISHHHAVGVDHAPYLAGGDRLAGHRSAARGQATLDPTGILNPGKLV